MIVKKELTGRFYCVLYDAVTHAFIYMVVVVSVETERVLFLLY